jgi:hypothetical protein
MRMQSSYRPAETKAPETETKAPETKTNAPAAKTNAPEATMMDLEDHSMLA